MWQSRRKQLMDEVCRLKWPAKRDPLAGPDGEDATGRGEPLSIDIKKQSTRECDRVYRLLSRAFHPGRSVQVQEGYDLSGSRTSQRPLYLVRAWSVAAYAYGAWS